MYLCTTYHLTIVMHACEREAAWTKRREREPGRGRGRGRGGFYGCVLRTWGQKKTSCCVHADGSKHLCTIHPHACWLQERRYRARRYLPYPDLLESPSIDSLRHRCNNSPTKQHLPDVPPAGPLGFNKLLNTGYCSFLWA